VDARLDEWEDDPAERVPHDHRARGSADRPDPVRQTRGGVVHGEVGGRDLVTAPLELADEWGPAPRSEPGPVDQAERRDRSS